MNKSVIHGRHTCTHVQYISHIYTIVGRLLDQKCATSLIITFVTCLNYLKPIMQTCLFRLEEDCFVEIKDLALRPFVIETLITCSQIGNKTAMTCTAIFAPSSKNRNLSPSSRLYFTIFWRTEIQLQHCNSYRSLEIRKKFKIHQNLFILKIRKKLYEFMRICFELRKYFFKKWTCTINDHRNKIF